MPSDTQHKGMPRILGGGVHHEPEYDNVVLMPAEQSGIDEVAG